MLDLGILREYVTIEPVTIISQLFKKTYYGAEIWRESNLIDAWVSLSIALDLTATYL